MRHKKNPKKHTHDKHIQRNLWIFFILVFSLKSIFRVWLIDWMLIFIYIYGKNDEKMQIKWICIWKCEKKMLFFCCKSVKSILRAFSLLHLQLNTLRLHKDVKIKSCKQLKYKILDKMNLNEQKKTLIKWKNSSFDVYFETVLTEYARGMST